MSGMITCACVRKRNRFHMSVWVCVWLVDSLTIQLFTNKINISDIPCHYRVTRSSLKKESVHGVDTTRQCKGEYLQYDRFINY